MAVLAGGCGDDLTACEHQPDLSGVWTFHITPSDGETVPRAATVRAELRQVRAQGTFSFARYLFGTLSSEDKGFFDVVQIPELMKNNGGKTGSVLNCAVQINVPIAMPVTDDNQDQGPLRVAFGGTIVAKGRIEGKPELSSVIMVEDQTMTPRRFRWNGEQ